MATAKMRLFTGHVPLVTTARAFIRQDWGTVTPFTFQTWIQPGPDSKCLTFMNAQNIQMARSSGMPGPESSFGANPGAPTQPPMSGGESQWISNHATQGTRCGP